MILREITARLSFLNDVAAKNYDPSKGRTGWFDKVFK